MLVIHPCTPSTVEIYPQCFHLPFKVAIDSRSRAVRFRVLHRYLATNMFLHKIGLVTSPLCSFCKQENWWISEHLFINCVFSSTFWQSFISFCNGIEIRLNELSDVDKIFGICENSTDFLMLNHLIILAKQHIHSCSSRDCVPSLNIYLSKVAFTYHIETIIADSNGKRSFRDAKWKKYVQNNKPGSRIT